MASIGGCCSSSSVALRTSLPPHAQLRHGSRLPPSFFSVAPRRPRNACFRIRAVLTVSGGLQHRQPAPRLPERPETAFLENLFYKEAEEEEEKEERVSAEKIDGWMKESISEIVRNIGEAPFLVQLFNSGGGGGGLTLLREPAVPDSWPQIKKRWGRDGQPRPDGIILVEELVADDEEGNANAATATGPIDKASKMWGLVVQSRGMDCVACYVLDTCRVRSPAGFCTHFCLARAQCFGDPLELQLRNAWLQRLSR